MLFYQGNYASSGNLKDFGFSGNRLLYLAHNAFCLGKFQHPDILSESASLHINPAVIFDVIQMITVVEIPCLDILYAMQI